MNTTLYEANRTMPAAPVNGVPVTVVRPAAPSGPSTETELDADLVKALRHSSYMRRGFYVVVLLVALAGQVSGAVEALGIPLVWAVPAVAALELGGVVVLSNADVRRRLGERAIGSRILSAAIAVGATAFNWLAHENKLLGGFLAGMSALGYLVWLTHTDNQRRDRLRAKGHLPPTTPAYEAVGHWLRHPWLTRRARSLAKAQPHLGLYDSLAAARAEIKRERRESAISKVLHRKIRAAVDPTTADIAIAVYDLGEIAGRLAEQADYDGLTSIIAETLTADRLAADRDNRPVSAIPGTLTVDDFEVHLADVDQVLASALDGPEPGALAGAPGRPAEVHPEVHGEVQSKVHPSAPDERTPRPTVKRTRTQGAGAPRRAAQSAPPRSKEARLTLLKKLHTQTGGQLSVRGAAAAIGASQATAKTLLTEAGLLPSAEGPESATT